MAKRRTTPRSDAAQRFPPLPMLDIYIPMMRCAAILAAGRIGLFEQLTEGPKKLSVLAAALNLDRNALERLLRALRYSGYVTPKAKDTWANSSHTERWFTRNGRVDYSSGLAWTAEAWLIAADLHQDVRRGSPKTQLWAKMKGNPELGARFSRYMHAFALHASPSIASLVTLPPGARHIFDIGGSHGLHSIALCKKYPKLSATILDHASALTETVGIIRQHDLADRITVMEGDCRKAAFPKDQDAVLLYSVAHNQTPADNDSLFRKIGSAVRPGGLLVLHDYLPGATPGEYLALFDLTLLSEVGTRTYHLKEFQSWATHAGFGRIRVSHLEPSEMGSVMVAKLKQRGVRK